MNGELNESSVVSPQVKTMVQQTSLQDNETVPVHDDVLPDDDIDDEDNEEEADDQTTVEEEEMEEEEAELIPSLPEIPQVVLAHVQQQQQQVNPSSSNQNGSIREQLTQEQIENLVLREFCQAVIHRNQKMNEYKHHYNRIMEEWKQLTLQLNQELINYNTTCLPVYYDAQIKKIMYLRRMMKTQRVKNTEERMESTLNKMRDDISNNQLGKLPLTITGPDSRYGGISVMNAISSLFESHSEEQCVRKFPVIDIRKSRERGHFSFDAEPVNDALLTRACQKFLWCKDKVRMLRKKMKLLQQEFNRVFGALRRIEFSEKADPRYRQMYEQRKNLLETVKQRKKNNKADHATSSDHENEQHATFLKQSPEFQALQLTPDEIFDFLSSYLKKHGGVNHEFKFKIQEETYRRDEQGNIISHLPPVVEDVVYKLMETTTQRAYVLTSSDQEGCKNIAWERTLKKYNLDPQLPFDVRNQAMMQILQSPVFHQDIALEYKRMVNVVKMLRPMVMRQLVLRRGRKKNNNPLKLSQTEQEQIQEEQMTKQNMEFLRDYSTILDRGTSIVLDQLDTKNKKKDRTKTDKIEKKKKRMLQSVKTQRISEIYDQLLQQKPTEAKTVRKPIFDLQQWLRHTTAAANTTNTMNVTNATDNKHTNTGTNVSSPSLLTQQQQQQPTTAVASMHSRVSVEQQQPQPRQVSHGTHSIPSTPASGPASASNNRQHVVEQTPFLQPSQPVAILATPAQSLVNPGVSTNTFTNTTSVLPTMSNIAIPTVTTATTVATHTNPLYTSVNNNLLLSKQQQQLVTQQALRQTPPIGVASMGVTTANPVNITHNQSAMPHHHQQSISVSNHINPSHSTATPLQDMSSMDQQNQQNDDQEEEDDNDDTQYSDENMESEGEEEYAVEENE